MNCFTVKTTDNNSVRQGTLSTAHGDVQTPTFMPVGTRGSVKASPHNTSATPDPK